MLQKWIFFLLFVSLSLALPSGARWLTSGFKVAKLQCSLPYRSEWDAKLLASEAVLAQSFRYLGKGRQCYVFESEDGKYVIKLFRFDPKGKTQLETALRLFAGCMLALSVPEETGLLYLHLNETEGLFSPFRGKGPLGRRIRLDLDRCRFALQRKALPFGPELFKARDEGRLEERIEQIVSLLERRIARGIGNNDPSLWRNFGFLEGQAIEIDFGNFVSRPDFADRKQAEQELARYLGPLRSWLERNAPGSLPFFDARRNR